MNAHHTDRIGSFTQNIGFPIIDLILLHLLHISYKMEQPFIACRLKCFCFYDQKFQIGRPLFSARHCRYHFPISRFLHDFPQKFMNCCIGNASAKFQNLCKHSLYLHPEFFWNYRLYLSCSWINPCHPQNSLMKWKIRIHRPDLCQLFIGAFSKRRFQNCCQWNILPEIIQHPQIIHHPTDFQCGKIAFFRL